MQIFNRNKNETNFVSSPFWQVGGNSKKNAIKNIFKQIFFFIKLSIFIFMLVMGLWGCSQTSFDATTSQNLNIGCGLEYGYQFGTTGDYNFDVQAASNFSQYSTFTDWSMAYGPFYAFFIWPAAFFITNFMYLTRNYWGGTNTLLSLFILLLIIRGSTLLLSLKSTFHNEKMLEIKSKISQINNKYKDLKDFKSRQMKQYEITNLYKKNKIKPFAAFQQMFLTMPIFLIIYRIVGIVRPIKSSVLFNIWSFSANPLTETFSNFSRGGWVYIFFLIIVMSGQFFSLKIPQILAKKRYNNNSNLSSDGNGLFNKTKITQNIFIVVMCLIVVFSPCGVGIYWFLSSIFSVAQSYMLHKILLRRKHTNKKFKISFDF